MAGDLASLISKRLQSGMSPAEVQVYLQSRGYANQDIANAYARYNYRQNLANYISRQRAAGYHPPQIRNSLLTKGYPAQDVDAAFAILKGSHHFGIQSLVVIAIVIAFISLGTVIAFLLLQNPQDELLDYKIIPEKKTFMQDEKLRFDVKLMNFGSKNRYDVILTHSIIKSGRQVDFVTETLAVETQITSKVDMDISELEPGSYVLKSKVEYKGNEVESSFSFNIKASGSDDPDIPEGQDPTDVTEVPDNPDDQYEPDNPGERYRRDDVQSPKDKIGLIIEEIENAIDIKSAEKVCEAEDDLLYRDYCWEQVATYNNEAGFCRFISNDENKDFCYITIALNTGDVEICSKIGQVSIRASCMSI